MKSRSLENFGNKGVLRVKQCLVLRFLLLLHVMFIMNLYAETPEDIAKEAHLANINALLIFTSQNGLNSGRYHFSKVGVDMEVYHLPFTYHFDSVEAIGY